MIPEVPLCFTNPAGDAAITEQNAGRRCELHQGLIAANLTETSVPGTPMC